METRLIIAYSLILVMVVAAITLGSAILRKRSKRREIDAGRADYRK
jgi:hypothetical protein